MVTEHSAAPPSEPLILGVSGAILSEQHHTAPPIFPELPLAQVPPQSRQLCLALWKKIKKDERAMIQTL